MLVQSLNGKRADAIDKLQVGLQKVRKENASDLRWTLANMLLDDTRIDDARKLVKEIRETNAASADYLEARAHMQRARWFEAVRQFERIRPGFKNIKELAYQIDLHLGVCYDQMEQPIPQLTAYQRAIEIAPASLAARRGMASAYWALGQADDALRISQEIAAQTTDPEEAGRRRLEHLRKLLESGKRQSAEDWKKIEQALDDLDKTLAKSPDVALLRAEALFVQGDKANAESLLQKMIAEFPDRHEPWLALISFAAAKNDIPLARQRMKMADERFKGNASFRLAQIRFWASQRDAEAAAELKAIEAAGDQFTPREQSPLWQALAEAYYFADKHADAARMLQAHGQAADARPGFARARPASGARPVAG